MALYVWLVLLLGERTTKQAWRTSDHKKDLKADAHTSSVKCAPQQEVLFYDRLLWRKHLSGFLNSAGYSCCHNVCPSQHMSDCDLDADVDA